MTLGSGVGSADADADADADVAVRRADTHDRVRHDKIDKAGSVTLRVAGRLLAGRGGFGKRRVDGRGGGAVR
jgi:hypothetical protein